MPNTLISVRGPLPEDRSEPVMAAVHAALVEALRIPQEDRCLRLQRFAEADFESDPRHARYVLVEIDLFAGRSLAAKRSLYRAIVRNLQALGYAADAMRVVLREVPLDNWGLRGGVPASELELGFSIEV